MAYGIIRVSNLSMAEIRKAEIHNARLFEENNIPLPENIKPENEGYYGANRYEIRTIENGEGYQSGSLLKAVRERLEETGVSPRINAVAALEFIVSASIEFFDNYSADSHFSAAERWLAGRYGKENIIASYRHYDEQTPHAHIIVTPVVEKEVRWKNARGEGIKREQRLCARDITGGRSKLRQLQEDYHQFIKPYGDSHGVNFYRGTLVEHQKKEYTNRTNHELGEIRNQIAGLDKSMKELTEHHKLANQTIDELIETKKKLAALQEKKSGLDKQLNKGVKQSAETIDQLQREVERRKRLNKGKGWQKGNNFEF